MGVGAVPAVMWSGGVQVTLECACDRAWAIFADFGGLCKWNPAVTVCDLVEGNNNEPGSLRFCKGALPDSWVYERLLDLDELNFSCTYRMEDNRFRFPDGVRGYVSHIQFRELGEGKTDVEWTYTVEPVATQTYEQFTAFMTGFYLYNLNILQCAANAATTATTITTSNTADMKTTEEEKTPLLKTSTSTLKPSL